MINDLQASILEGYRRDRDPILDALKRSSHREDINLHARMELCGSAAGWLIDLATRRVRNWIARCKARYCAFCANARHGHVAAYVQAMADMMPQRKHIVLTTRSNPDPLARQLDTNRDSFTSLRHSPAWRAAIRGGVYTHEVTDNPATGQWHPHVHVLCDGSYYRWQDLRADWRRITGGSDVIRIMQVTDTTRVIRDLCKYTSKPDRLRDWTPRKIVEYVHATRGRRMLNTFGTFHGFKLEHPDDFKPLPSDAPYVGIRRLAFLAAAGAEAPQRVLLLAAERTPRFLPWIAAKVPQLGLVVPDAREIYRAPDVDRSDRRAQDLDRRFLDALADHLRAEADHTYSIIDLHAYEDARGLAVP